MFDMAERIKQYYAGYRQVIKKAPRNKTYLICFFIILAVFMELPDAAFNSTGSKYIYIVFLIITLAVTGIFDFRYVKKEAEDKLTEKELKYYYVCNAVIGAFGVIILCFLKFVLLKQAC